MMLTEEAHKFERLRKTHDLVHLRTKSDSIEGLNNLRKKNRAADLTAGEKANLKQVQVLLP